MGDHPRGRVAVWALVALAGLAIAVVLSVAASNLSTQPIGLSAEPLRPGERLAPADVALPDPSRPAKTKRTATHTTTTPAVTTTPQTSSGSGGGEAGDDHGGRHTDGDDD